MSLILDALKKAQHKTEVASPVQEQSVQNHKPTGTSSRRVVLLFILFLVAGGMWFMRDKLFLPTFESQEVAVKSTLKQVKTAVVPKPVDPVALEKAKMQKEMDTINQLISGADMQFQNGDYAKSAEAYKQLLLYRPSQPEVYNNYGMALRKLGRIDEAKQAYMTALALKPEYAEALNNFAVLLMEDRQYSEAKSHLEKALLLNAQYTDALLHLGLCFEKMGDVSHSIGAYQRYLKASSGDMNRNLRIQIENRIVKLSEEL